MRTIICTILIGTLLIIEARAKENYIYSDTLPSTSVEWALEIGWYSSLPLTKYNYGLPATRELDYVFQPWGYTVIPSRGLILNIQYDHLAFNKLILRSGVSFISSVGG